MNADTKITYIFQRDHEIAEKIRLNQELKQSERYTEMDWGKTATAEVSAIHFNA